ncbi:MAG: UDP-N-acetylglucosamine 1-carboxyvinyltransferase [Lentimicrobiaceae bacterium]|jgi:UDP-N-acetylglucosamine 1-carboxyvinyltransferase|nr:UDP-N-acetylglucosamine 1-carboxyvinyltransferase [Lentimicrobiaceae bacterium]MCP4911116.1 UDP-N-acetylglucosamine 1-carboxyvinyltransferase [Bacteroidota bacterium]MBT3453510.1 UDP-N-acetylglucosamine 1-carboxyvinyltransferase [Lentimicrobiaceae bacterium]MBT3818011.1 UDP-N-acetylglucosamine 1-carboxyvinyltransferase [Lentimicrobiaceae bacterium]MBT4062138.1 UDP-N-acetylglucosamine 1-carboxyvinyltransferase [Lentimicrobiaceae bacterium]
MGTFKITGGNSLGGEIIPQGAKNEALQIICAVLLTNEKVILNNVPNIRDVNKLIDLLRGLGVEVIKINENKYSFDASAINLKYLETEDFYAKATSIRGSVMILGPLLARFGKGTLPQPGGDKIGRRRLDTHFIGLQKLGAEFKYDPDKKSFKVVGKNLNGNYMLLEEASVTGTANILMASVLAKGITTIFNAACEPYLIQLCKMLVRMGAKITGIGSNLLTIEGVKSLTGTEHTMLADMIEVGSFIGLAAMTQSEIIIKNVSLEDLGLIPTVFKRLGIEVVQNGDDILVPKYENYNIETFIDGSIMNISDAPWPGFTPDLISIILVTAIQANGSVLIHQKMFESRLFFVDKLIDMGAKIILCDPHRATVIGMNHKTPLRGIKMSSPDIRAGVALLTAALSAQGTSIIENIEQIDRGYQNIDLRLQKLGADIERLD